MRATNRTVDRIFKDGIWHIWLLRGMEIVLFVLCSVLLIIVSCLSCIFCPLYCQSFFDLQFLITTLWSSNFSSICTYYMMWTEILLKVALNTITLSPIWCDATLYDVTQHYMMWHNTIWCDATLYDVTQHYMMWRNTIWMFHVVQVVFDA